MRKNSKQGFGKIKWLIAIGAFVLVVAIAIPVGFGFNKENHPEVNTNIDKQIESTVPSDLKEVELGIIGGVRPGDVNFSEQTEQNTLTDERDNETVVSQKPNATEKITGTVDCLDKTTYVENKGAVVDVPEKQEYTKVHVDSSLTVPLPKDFNNGSKKEDDDRKVIEVDAEKEPLSKESEDQVKKDAEKIFEAENADQDDYLVDFDELFGDSKISYTPVEEANPDDYAFDIYELFGRTGTVQVKPVNPDEYSFDVNDIDEEALWDELNNK